MTENENSGLSRRKFIRSFTLGTAVLAYGPTLHRIGRAGTLLSGLSSTRRGPASYRFRMNENWLFGGEFFPEALTPAFDDKSFSSVTLPHCVNELSWHNWDPYNWEKQWVYRRHFDLPKESKARRVFLNFEGVMVGTTPVVNGHQFPQYLGGYLPSRFEITDFVKETGNVLAVKVDSRWSNTPPEGSPEGPRRIDYLEPGGVIRPVHIDILPRTFISDLFAKPVRVLDTDREIEVVCTVDTAGVLANRAEIEVELRDREEVLSRARENVKVQKVGKTQVRLTLSKLGNTTLWSPDNPKLYDVVATLLIDGKPAHDYKVRTGLRDARFELDGFYLNGKRLQIFGLNSYM